MGLTVTPYAPFDQNPIQLLQGTDYTLLTSYGMYAPDFYEIVNTFYFELGTKAVFEIG